MVKSYARRRRGSNKKGNRKIDSLSVGQIIRNSASKFSTVNVKWIRPG